jgi:hypothetical protein
MRNQYKEAEFWARRRFNFLTDNGYQGQASIDAARALKFQLKRLGRGQEANAIKEPGDIGVDLFLTDDDKRALREAASKSKRKAGQ